MDEGKGGAAVRAARLLQCVTRVHISASDSSPVVSLWLSLMARGVWWEGRKRGRDTTSSSSLLPSHHPLLPPRALPEDDWGRVSLSIHTICELSLLSGSLLYSERFFSGNFKYFLSAKANTNFRNGRGSLIKMRYLYWPSLILLLINLFIVHPYYFTCSSNNFRLESSNGSLAHNIVNSTTPKLQTSERVPSYAIPRRISGGAYA